jgi:O-antigen/teichoic acid export membrane protein
MIKNIAGTALTRGLNAVLMLVVLYLATHFLGAENYGTVTLIILGVAIIHLINNIIGGSALVYYVPRVHLFLLLVPSYFWAFLSAIMGALALTLLDRIPQTYTFHVMFLGFLLSLTTINQNVLLGKEKIHLFNLVSLLQFTMLLAALSYFIFIRHEHKVFTYVKALYLGYGAAFILSFILIYKRVKMTDLQEAGAQITKLISFGWKAQLANILQFFNYRLGFYILEYFFSRALLGVFSAGVQLSEGLWIIGKSVTMVQFSRTSNSDDKDYIRQMTISMWKITLLLTLFLLIFVLLIPTNWFVIALGNDFIQIKRVILTLAPGILIVPSSMVFGSFFSGIGKPQVSTIASGIGLLVMVLIGFAIIPTYGLEAAGIASSVTYLTTGIYFFYRFLKETSTKPQEFLINRKDLEMLKKLWHYKQI